jgi:hypothetical protein
MRCSLAAGPSASAASRLLPVTSRGPSAAANRGGLGAGIGADAEDGALEGACEERAQRPPPKCPRKAFKANVTVGAQSYMMLALPLHREVPEGDSNSS